MAKNLLQEQIDYYRARASEYDDWFYRRGRYYKGEKHLEQWNVEVGQLRAELAGAEPSGTVLELACGTGIWTRELCRSAESVHAVDSSPEVLSICQSKVRHPRLTTECQDLFEWVPARKYDFVFFSFWLSHVPPSRFSFFWEKVASCLANDGVVFFIDSAEHLGVKTDAKSRSTGPEWVARRNLRDGREFDIVKIFYRPDALAKTMQGLGWVADVGKTGQFFIYGKLSKCQRQTV